MARPTLWHRIARLHPFVWIGTAAVVAGLVAWPLGGWDTVELQSTKIPQYQPGDLVVGHQWSVRVQSAEFVDVHPDGFSELEPGWSWLKLDLEATNETDATDSASDFGSDYKGVLTIDGGALGYGTTAENSEGNLERGKTYLVSDGTYLPDLQPGLPADIEIVFEVPEGTWEVGDDLTVGIIDRTRTKSTLGSGYTYLFPRLIAEVTVPIDEGRT
jgi:hypothetical protein